MTGRHQSEAAVDAFAAAVYLGALAIGGLAVGVAIGLVLCGAPATARVASVVATASGVVAVVALVCSHQWTGGWYG